MENNNNFEQAAQALIATEKNVRAIKRAAKGIQAYGRASEGLANLNTMRGGTKGFKGFVMEELEAAEASARGRMTQVINNNGISDLRHLKTNGTEALKQVKNGYGPRQINFPDYKGQTVIIDKGNPNFHTLKAEGAKAGVKVVEGHVTAQEAKAWADAMQWEKKVIGKITGGKNAPITSTIYRGVKTASAVHRAGCTAAKTGTIGGTGYSIGSNVVSVMRGKKSLGHATMGVVTDTVKAYAASYLAGAIGSTIASTETGAEAMRVMKDAWTKASNAPGISDILSAGNEIAGDIGTLSSEAATVATDALCNVINTAGTIATRMTEDTIFAETVDTTLSATSKVMEKFSKGVVDAAPTIVPMVIAGAVFEWFFDD